MNGFGEDLRQAEGAVRGTDGHDPVVVLLGAEGLQLVVEVDLAAVVTPQVKSRVPATGHGDEIGFRLRLLDHAALALAVRGDLDVGDVEAAPAGVDGRDDGTGIDRNAHLARLVGQSPLGTAAAVDDADADACILQHDGRLVGVVIVGEDHAVGARCHAIALHHATRGGREHHARTIVVGECDGPFDGARGEDHLMGAHLPQAVARHALRKERRVMVRHALEQHDEVVVPVADNSRAVQHMHVLGGIKLGARGCGPVGQRLTVDGAAGDVGKAAQMRVLVGDDDLGAIGRSGFRCSKAGNAAADHQHVAMDVDLLVGVRVAAFRRLAQARRTADEGLVDVLPERLRPHECLVVEAAGQEARDLVVDGADVPVQRRPAVLRDGRHAIEDLDLGGTQVRLMARTLAHADEGVHFLRAQPHKPTRAMILEAAAEHALARGQHGGGDGVALETGYGLAVEGEGDLLAAVDEAPAGRETIWLAHALFSDVRRLAKYSAHWPLAWAITSAGGSSVMP